MRSIVKCIDQTTSDRFALYHGDSCEVVKAIPDSSVHYSVFSPPFASLYTYSASDRDMGNSATHGDFYKHFAFLVGELLRVTIPGRLLSFHCMNLPTSKQRDGFIGLSDFRGILIKAFMGKDAADMIAAASALRVRALRYQLDEQRAEWDRLMTMADDITAELNKYPGDAGFIYHSEVCIWKDPVTAMQRTKALGLLHKTIRKDSAMSRQGIPDYLVTMRKPGENPEPVEHPDETYPVKLWQRVASPIWVTTRGVDDEGFKVCVGDDDGSPDSTIIPGDTLQKESAREDADERHVCPLQLSVIRRALRLWTNPGDVVLSPFAGIGSEGYVALQEGRRFVGVELKGSYYQQAAANLRAAEKGAGAQGDLFAVK